MSQELPQEVKDLDRDTKKALVNLIDSRKRKGNEEARGEGSPA